MQKYSLSLISLRFLDLFDAHGSRLRRGGGLWDDGGLGFLGGGGGDGGGGDGGSGGSPCGGGGGGGGGCLGLGGQCLGLGSGCLGLGSGCLGLPGGLALLFGARRRFRLCLSRLCCLLSDFLLSRLPRKEHLLQRHERIHTLHCPFLSPLEHRGEPLRTSGLQPVAIFISRRRKMLEFSLSHICNPEELVHRHQDKPLELGVVEDCQPHAEAHGAKD